MKTIELLKKEKLLLEWCMRVFSLALNNSLGRSIFILTKKTEKTGYFLHMNGETSIFILVHDPNLTYYNHSYTQSLLINLH